MTSKIRIDFGDSSDEGESSEDPKNIPAKSKEKVKIPERLPISEKRPKYAGNAYIYIRVSGMLQLSHEQYETITGKKMKKRDYEEKFGVHISPEIQENKCRTLCEKNNWKVIDVQSDLAKSGKESKMRLGLHSIISRLEKGDAFVVYSVSRFSRSFHDAHEIFSIIDRKEAFIVSATEEHVDTRNHVGRLVFTIMLHISEQYRLNLSQNIKDAFKRKKDRGEYVGGIPYGKTYNKETKKLEINKEEAEMIEKILHLRKNFEIDGEKIDYVGKKKTLPYEKIVEELNKRGYKREPFLFEGRMIDNFTISLVSSICRQFEKKSKKKEKETDFEDIYENILENTSDDQKRTLIIRLSHFLSQTEE